MGTYLNPGNSGFAEILQSDYVDKTGLISLINSTIGTKKKLTCISRPRRFGKSYAAQMLCAYYDKTCDSHELFNGFRIAQDSTYERHIGKYDVIYWDMTGIKPYTEKYSKLVPFLVEKLSAEIRQQYPETTVSDDLSDTLSKAAETIGNKFIILIDEWDAPIRENPSVSEDYLEFLRSLFKNSATTSKIFAAAYMTGILPIKKDGSQSAISDFDEYTMIKPRQFAEYVGFTEEEVRKLCDQHEVSFEQMKQWYDGYEFKDVGAVYNPNSVMKAIRYDDFDSYWTETSAAEGLMDYISKPYNGMAKTIAELIGGVDVKVNTNGFANDLVTFKGRDDVLTLMIHLGYLAYNSETKTVHIPNEEIKLEFQKAIREVHHEETAKRLSESDQLFLDTLEMKAEAVAAQIEKIHREETAPLLYSKEDSLRSVIKLAYYTYRDHYLQFEELPSGDGYADIVYLPKQDSDWPALVIELKWNKGADAAISQIKDRRYPEVLKGYGGDILLVGINYDKDAPVGERKHSCKIEKYRMDFGLSSDV
jgi:hypothetical protein